MNEALLRYQRALDQFEVSADEPDFGVRVLGAYVKKGPVGESADLSAYSLAGDVKLNGTHYGRRFRDRYFDATYNFCLTHGEELVASLGFECDGDELVIWQLQGKKGAAAQLRPIKWQRALVEHALVWAAAQGLTCVTMASVDNVSWARQHGHLDREQGRMIYDVTAKRCGFTRGPEGYWVYPSSTSSSP
jgi:hypothetical protein